MYLKRYKVIIVGDFEIHVDVENNGLDTTILSLLDYFGSCQCVQESRHTFNHTLDLVLTYAIEIEHLKDSTQNMLLIRSLSSNI